MVPVRGGNIIPILQDGPDIVGIVNQTYNFPDWVTTLSDQGPDTQIINE